MDKEKELQLQVDYLQYRLSIKGNIQEEIFKEAEAKAKQQAQHLGADLIAQINKDIALEF
jgi:hypothetical protein